MAQERDREASGARALPAGVALDHCVIHVTNWERSNRFYAEVLGAELIDRDLDTWAYRFGAVQLNLTARTSWPTRSP